MKKKSIAVIGQGFVGGSLTTVFAERGFDVHTYDVNGFSAEGSFALSIVEDAQFALNSAWFSIDEAGNLTKEKWGNRLNASVAPDKGIKKLVSITESDDSVKQCSKFTGVYFLCLPTPMLKTGQCDTSIVESVLEELAAIPGAENRVAVIKSTIPPGTTEYFNKKFSGTGLGVVFNPEFLTERTALHDMRHQSRIIIGGEERHSNRVRDVYRAAFHDVPIVKTSSTTAEMVKYMRNCFFAAKVSIANEFWQLCSALARDGYDIDYDRAIECSSYDQRFGSTHWNVPGPDGDRGFGGSCFPKDINALIFLAKEYKIDPKMMSATWEKNLEVRRDKNWERLVGRVVAQDIKEQDDEFAEAAAHWAKVVEFVDVVHMQK